MKCKQCGTEVREPRYRELLIGFVAATVPFWAFATNWRDLSEAKASGLGAAFLATILGIYRIWKGNPK